MRSEIAEIDRDQGSACDIFAAPGNRPVPAQASDGMASSLFGRRLDRDRLACHHGGRGSQRLSGRGGTGAVLRGHEHQLSRPRSGPEWVDEAVWMRLIWTSVYSASAIQTAINTTPPATAKPQSNAGAPRVRVEICAQRPHSTQR